MTKANPVSSSSTQASYLPYSSSYPESASSSSTIAPQPLEQVQDELSMPFQAGSGSSSSFHQYAPINSNAPAARQDGVLELEELHTDNAEPNFEDPSSVKKLSLKQLREIRKIHRSRGSVDKSLGECLKPFVNLTHLKLSLISAGELAELAPILKELKNLSGLKISSASITDLECLSGITQLKTLDLIGLLKLSKLPDFAENTELRELNLVNCLSLYSLKGLENCKQLSSARIKNCSNLQSLKGIENCKDLSHIELSELINLTTVEDLKECQNLSSVALNGHSRLKSFKGLDTFLHSLQSFEYPDAYSIASLEGFENSPHIGLIKLASCDSLQSIKELNCPRLAWFEIYSAKDLKTLEGLEKSRMLATLILQHAVSLTSLEAVRGCRELDYVCLNGCSNITSLKDFEECHYLRELDLRGCVSLKSLEGLQNIRGLQKIILSDDQFCEREIRDLWEIGGYFLVEGSLDNRFLSNFLYSFKKIFKIFSGSFFEKIGKAFKAMFGLN